MKRLLFTLLALVALHANAQVFTGGLIRPNSPFIGQILAPDGTAATPSYSFASEPNTGIFRNGTSTLAFTSLGNQQFMSSSGEIRMVAGLQLGWTSGNLAVLADTVLVRDAANTLAQRNGTNAQAFRLYNTFTDVSNKEYGELVWSSGNLYLQTNAVGTGVQRNVVVRTLGGTNVYFGVNGINRFRIDATAGHFFAETDNTNDIGALGANRPRNIYAGSAIFTTAPNTQTGAAYTVLATDNYLIANAAATQTLTLPTASSNTGRAITVKTTAAFAVVSNASNVVPCAGGAAGTAILTATAGKWADLVSDGTNWVIMRCN